MLRQIRELNSRVYCNLAMGSAFGSMLSLVAILFYVEGSYASLIVFGVYVFAIFTSYIVGKLTDEE